MNKLLLLPFTVFLTTIAFTAELNARPGGCVKGAIAGGIAGHFVGHGGIGAVAGCAYGIHKRHEYERERKDRSSYERHQENR